MPPRTGDLTRATENAESCNSRVGCTTRLQKALLYARTLRHLRVGQVAALIGNRVRRLDLPRAIPDVGAFGSVRPVRQFISAVAHAAAGGEIELINRRRPFKVSGPDWNADDMPKLWRYNLHYFDFLHGTSYSNEDKATLICDWIEHVHPGSGDGWEPYPLSLRIVNWLKFLSDRPSDTFAESVDRYAWRRNWPRFSRRPRASSTRQSSVEKRQGAPIRWHCIRWRCRRRLAEVRNGHSVRRGGGADLAGRWAL